MNCPKCNAALAPEATVCSVCGTPVQQIPPETQQPETVPPQGYAQPPYGMPSQQQPGTVPPQGYPPQPGYGVPPQGYAPQPGYGVPPQGYPQQPGTVPPQGYAQPPYGMPSQQQPGTVPPQGYPQQPGTVPPQGYAPQPGYAVPPQGYPQQPGTVPPQGYPQQPGTVPPQGYPYPGYAVPPAGYVQPGYAVPPAGYVQPGYAVPPAGYVQPGYGMPPIQPEAKPKKKRKSTYILLGVFLGGLGVHDFYVGKKIPGFIHILLCVSYLISIVLSAGSDSDTGYMVAFLILIANGFFALIELFLPLPSPSEEKTDSDKKTVPEESPKAPVVLQCPKCKHVFEPDFDIEKVNSGTDCPNCGSALPFPLERCIVKQEQKSE